MVSQSLEFFLANRIQFIPSIQIPFSIFTNRLYLDFLDVLYRFPISNIESVPFPASNRWDQALASSTLLFIIISKSILENLFTLNISFTNFIITIWGSLLSELKRQGHFVQKPIFKACGSLASLTVWFCDYVGTEKKLTL